MHRTIFAVSCILFCAVSLYAQEQTSEPKGEDFVLSSSLEAGVLEGRLNGGLVLGVRVESGAFTGLTGLRYVNDAQYLPSDSFMKDGLYFDPQESWIRFSLDGFTLKGGYFDHAHALSQNPYNVLHNPASFMSPAVDLSWDAGAFYYETRWSGLNFMSGIKYDYSTEYGDAGSQNWRDKGLNSRLLALKLGDLRIAYEESSVYLNRYFDPLYFFAPLPSIVSNTVWSNQTTEKNPWASTNNDSSLMGFYADYTRPDWRAEGQILIKDLNTTALGFGFDNVSKFAWSAGGSLDTELGTFGFWHGGATKHMYAATYQETGASNKYPYQYVVYPVAAINGREIDPLRNNLGLASGENSLAFRADWNKHWELAPTMGLDTRAGLRWIMRGEQSPHNPWHDATWVTRPAVQLFTNDPAIEHTLGLDARVAFTWLDLEAVLSLDVGAAFNALRLRPANDVGADIWSPRPGQTDTFANCKLVLTWGFHLE